jgi:hypothetical protein
MRSSMNITNGKRLLIYPANNLYFEYYMKKIILLLIIFSFCLPLSGCSSSLPEYEYTYYPNNHTLSSSEAKSLFIRALDELSVKQSATLETLGEDGQFNTSTYSVTPQGLQLISQEKPLSIKVYRRGFSSDCIIILTETFFDSGYEYMIGETNYTVIDFIENRTEYYKSEDSIIKKESSTKFGTVNTDYYQPVIASPSNEETLPLSEYGDTISQYSDSLVFPNLYTENSISFSEQSESFFSGTMSGLQGVIRFNNFTPSGTNTMFDISITLSRGIISEIDYKSYEYIDSMTRKDCSCILYVSYSPEWNNQYSGTPI